MKDGPKRGFVRKEGGPATERHTSTSLREDTTLLFETLHKDNRHPDDAKRESFKRKFPLNQDCFENV